MRAFGGDATADLRPHHGDVLMGIRDRRGGRVLAIKCRFRKNIRGRRISMRPCVRIGQESEIREYFPVHTSWPMVRRQVEAGPLFHRGYLGWF